VQTLLADGIQSQRKSPPGALKRQMRKWSIKASEVPVRDPELMLAGFLPAGHSGRSLTTPYEKIAYHIHCNSSRRWLDDVMREQEGIDDDN
jgi:hypothetical protein